MSAYQALSLLLLGLLVLVPFAAGVSVEQRLARALEQADESSRARKVAHQRAHRRDTASILQRAVQRAAAFQRYMIEEEGRLLEQVLINRELQVFQEREAVRKDMETRHKGKETKKKKYDCNYCYIYTNSTKYDNAKADILNVGSYKLKSDAWKSSMKEKYEHGNQLLMRVQGGTPSLPYEELFPKNAWEGGKLPEMNSFVVCMNQPKWFLPLYSAITMGFQGGLASEVYCGYRRLSEDEYPFPLKPGAEPPYPTKAPAKKEEAK